MTMFILLMINFSMTFMFLNHPISMGFILLMQTLTTALSMNLILKNAWFSYIIFLIMIGGLLIIFIYMTSLISNKKFKFSPKIMITNIIMMFSILYMNYYVNHYMIYNNYNNLTISFNKYINTSMFSIMILMIIYLLITMIAVVKITQFKSGALRQKF
uniref:NADH-ubiquinone oxidoreductase chain 6 n=1 Tax=Carpelimus sp. CAR01 TaxID=1205544 RepID=A0A0S2MR40_9COLE|nr:NADH deshydrogenase subunit 6 [Carpelimus sp. CAR01]